MICKRRTRLFNQPCFDDIQIQDSFAALLPQGDTFRLMFPPRRILVTENYVSKRRKKGVVGRSKKAKYPSGKSSGKGLREAKND